MLVTRNTGPAFNVVLPLLGAIVTDRGGQLSHAAIVAREYGIPAVVGTLEATTMFADGARVRVNGDLGIVELVERRTVRPSPLVDALDEAQFGGKAASLARSLRAGLPVPPGFALGTTTRRSGVRPATPERPGASANGVQRTGGPLRRALVGHR